MNPCRASSSWQKAQAHRPSSQRRPRLLRRLLLQRSNCCCTRFERRVYGRSNPLRASSLCDEPLRHRRRVLRQRRRGAYRRRPASSLSPDWRAYHHLPVIPRARWCSASPRDLLAIPVRCCILAHLLPYTHCNPTARRLRWGGLRRPLCAQLTPRACRPCIEVVPSRIQEPQRL